MATSTLGAQMHPELDRLKREFGWTPDSVATWDDSLRIWINARRTPDKSAYPDETWRATDALLDDSWWYRTRNEIILQVLNQFRPAGAIWDIGGGTGVVSRFLTSHQYRVIGVEPSRAGAILTASRGVHSFCAALEDLRLPTNSLTGITLFDVFEHLDDRPAALREIHRVLDDKGVLVLTVPALTTLWSQFDVDAGHYLRYNKRTLRKELESHGFEVVRSGYFFALTVIPLLLLRALPYRLGIRKAVATEATLGASGAFVGKLAAIVERAIALKTPIGSSLLVIAKKR